MHAIVRGYRGSRLAAADRHDLLTVLLLAALLAIALATFRHYAISNDEEVQQRYGELILNYYRSNFSDLSLFGYKNLYLYGGLFDIVSALLGQALPVDVYKIRHVLCALTGVAGIAATAATARLVAGPRAGLLAGLALTVCGVWYGAMFNHTKDIPFAAAMMGAGFFLLRFARDLPRPRRLDVIGFGILLGAAIGLRATALLMIGYAGLAVLASLRPAFARREAMAFLAYSTLRLLPAIVVAYAIMALAWPWAWQNSLNPLRAIFAFAHFHYEIRTIIAGHVYAMAEVPRWYVPLYIAVKLPLFLFVGALVALAPMIRSRLLALELKDVRRREVVLLAFMAAFPVACQVIARGPAFTGMRHFLFVVPPLAVLAAIGMEAMLRRAEQHGPSLARFAHVVLAGVFLWEAGLLIRLHPHQYIFYNSLVGGLEGASRRYVTDYWVNLMPEAAQALTAYVDRTDPNARAGRYTVAVCGERLAFEKEADTRFSWTGGWLEADFFIAPTHMDCDRVLRGPIALRIERLGVLIGVVQDLRGIPAQSRGFAGTAPR